MSSFFDMIEHDKDTIFFSDFAIDAMLSINSSNHLVKGLFDEAYLEDLGVSGKIYSFLYEATQAAEPLVGSFITIGSTDYEVYAIDDKKESGLTRLLLKLK